ncbi:hypothetical protein IEQ34_003350 [Dendrobium chrysotoxum]|uniref:Late embryogenesis abundant protein n=1 Tax=Dendrobium chrysotoxum TaxID=161865 RepID=A0AAV7HKD1_DENCH|nr:hypothetical protein IEQ34_003350 [Dendrobium chrysotoxum]
MYSEKKYGRRAIHLANHELSEKNTKGKGQRAEEPSWIPHPRTGIYYPEGNERVMEGIPQGAASFGTPYWLRNSEGVDKPVSADCDSDIFDHPFLDV